MRPLKSFKQLLWPIGEKKSKPGRDIESNDNTPAATAPFPDDDDCDVGDAVTETLEEIGDAISYYFLHPSKLSYDFSFVLTAEDLIFPVSTNRI